MGDSISFNRALGGKQREENKRVEAVWCSWWCRRLSGYKTWNRHGGPRCHEGAAFSSHSCCECHSAKSMTTIWCPRQTPWWQLSEAEAALKEMIPPDLILTSEEEPLSEVEMRRILGRHCSVRSKGNKCQKMSENCLVFQGSWWQNFSRKWWIPWKQN